MREHEREILVDAFIHGIGLFLVGAFGTVLVIGTPNLPNVVYILGMVIMIVCSCAYNLYSRDPRCWLGSIDRAAIFVMMAGTWTPILVYTLDPFWAHLGLLAVWAYALMGVLTMLSTSSPRVPVGAYMVLGWPGLFLYWFLDGATFALLAIGGVVFTIGAYIYAKHAWPYYRALWHVFVLVGGGLHFTAILSITPLEIT